MIVVADAQTPTSVTALLHAAHHGDREAHERLLPLIYDKLHAMAHRQLAAEHGPRTLQTTALVHEAYLRLIDQSQVTARGRAYFFAAAARAMRRVLIDRARRRKARKRGAGEAALPVDEVEVAVDAFAAELLDLDQALDRLAALDARQARVVECRFFGGLTIEETAEALGVSARTVRNDWTLARAWLHRALQSDAGA
jgi:RNA polymerase sigma factor (TIGR02999 family)